MNQSLRDMVDSPEQRKFGSDKADTLPSYCRRCEMRFACNGECFKHRFITTPDGEAGLNCLCAAYRRFFNHIDPAMKVMRDLVRAGQPAVRVNEIMFERRAVAMSKGDIAETILALRQRPQIQEVLQQLTIN